MKSRSWKETETLLKTQKSSWKEITNKLTVPLETIKMWAIDDSVPIKYYEKIKDNSREKENF